MGSCGSCACGCLKLIMFLFNFLFWVIGGTLLGVGIWLAVDDNAHDVLKIASSAGMDDALWSVAVYTLIGVGAFVFVIGFLGCCGTWGDGRKWMLVLYSILVTLVLIAEIVVVILAAIFYSEITENTKLGMQNDVRYKYGAEDDVTLTEAWDEMQRNWECCGSVDYTDYRRSYFHNTTTYLVPHSCCDGDNTIYDACLQEAAQQSPSYQYLYSQGCYEGLQEFLDENAIIVISITCGFVALEIIGLVIACCLMCRMKSSVV